MAKWGKVTKTSPFTSIKERVQPKFDLDKGIGKQLAIGMPQSFQMNLNPLARLKGDDTKDTNEKFPLILPFSTPVYYELINLTGQHAVARKKRNIAKELLSTLARMGLPSKTWLHQAQHYEQWHAKNARQAEHLLEPLKTRAAAGA